MVPGAGTQDKAARCVRPAVGPLNGSGGSGCLGRGTADLQQRGLAGLARTRPGRYGSRGGGGGPGVDRPCAVGRTAASRPAGLAVGSRQRRRMGGRAGCLHGCGHPAVAAWPGAMAGCGDRNRGGHPDGGGHGRGYRFGDGAAPVDDVGHGGPAPSRRVTGPRTHCGGSAFPLPQPGTRAERYPGSAARLPR